MKAVDIEFFPIPLELREPYTIAYHTVSSVTNVGMIITDSCGVSGVGISGPEEEVTGETADTVLRAASSVIEPYLRGRDLSNVDPLISELSSLLGYERAAAALADTALLHYASNKAGIPLAAFLGAARESLPTAVTIYIHPPEETVRRSERMVSEGYRILKIKGGLDPDEDIEKLGLLRAKFGFDLPLILDANQGYSRSDAIRVLEAASRLSVMCVEQPTTKSDRKLLGELAGVAPVMADESLVSEEDAVELGNLGIQFFNLKIMKAGGIRAVQAIDRAASRKSVKVITSCMDEAALANAYGLAFSLASPNVSFVDLDSFTDYKKDPTRAALLVNDGLLRCAPVDYRSLLES